MSDADEFIKRAEAAEKAAKGATDQWTMDALLKVAEEWRRQAAEAMPDAPPTSDPGSDPSKDRGS